MPDPVTESQPGSDNNEPNAQSDPPVGNQDGNGADGGGRTLENVRGELLRKQEKLSKQVEELTALIKAQQAGKQDGWSQQQSQFAPSPVPQPLASPFGAPRPLAQYNDDQLRVAATDPSIPPYQQEIIKQELRVRDDERNFNTRYEQRQRQERVNSLKQQAEKSALDSFPALRDSSSEFSRRVEAELAEQRRTIGEFPTDKFDVANRIARAMGVESTRAIVPGFVAPADGGNAPARQQNDGVTAMPDEDIDKLARKFAHTLPSKVDKEGRVVRKTFDTKKIKERSREYNQAAGAFRTRGVKVEG